MANRNFTRSVVRLHLDLYFDLTLPVKYNGLARLDAALPPAVIKEIADEPSNSATTRPLEPREDWAHFLEGRHKEGKTESEFRLYDGPQCGALRSFTA
jgi:hypothetical protein